MGGKGGELKDSDAIEGFASVISDLARTQFAEGLPALQQGGFIANELLTGNIPDSLRPVLQQQLEAARSAGSAAVRGTEEEAARAGLTGSALQEALAAARFAAESGAEATAAAPLAQAFSGAQQQTFALPGQGLQGLGTAGQVVGQALQTTPQTGGAAGAVGGALSGGATGATLGSAFPVVGTGIGAVLGAALGGFLGSR